MKTVINVLAICVWNWVFEVVNNFADHLYVSVMEKSHSCWGSDYAGYIWEALELEESVRNIERGKTTTEWSEWYHICLAMNTWLSTFYASFWMPLTRSIAQIYIWNQNFVTPWADDLGLQFGYCVHLFDEVQFGRTTSALLNTNLAGCNRTISYWPFV